MLFYGREGAGQEHLASALASAWLGREFSDGSERPAAVDFQWIAPAGPSRLIRQGAIAQTDGDDGSVVPLREFFRTRPLSAAHKVVVIEEAHRLVPGAANALLKMLEEPPPFARLILTTSSIGRLLPTIVSRCLSVAVELPDSADPQTEAERIFGEGSPGLVERVRKAGETYHAFLQLLESISGLPPVAALRLSESLRTIAENLEKVQGDGARTANAEVLRGVALWLGDRRPDWVQERLLAIEMHRRIVGNANAGMQFDALATSLLIRSSRVAELSGHRDP